MYHLAVRNMREFAKRLVVWAACFSLLLPAAAQDSQLVIGSPPGAAALEARIEWAANQYPILRRKDRLRKKPLKVQLFQVDRESIGDRQPLLLVHGLRGEFWRDFRWDRIIRRLTAHPDFCRKYKIYSLRYDSTDVIVNLLPQFKESLLDLNRQTGGKPVTILALSLGGNLAREAITDREVDRAIRLVFTLGTPFHGSPLFSRDWFMFSVYKNVSGPWTRIDRSLAFRFYFNRNPSLVTDLKWDNCDGFIPEVGGFKSRLPFGPRGDLLVATNANHKVLKLNQSGKVDKSKFITYAGYQLNPYMKPGITRYIDTTILYPYTWLTVKFPAHLAREHPVLNMLNRELARMIPDKTRAGAASSRFVYALNDGITPVSSALFVPTEACEACTMARESDLNRLKPYLDVRQARAFRNIDHLTFIDGFRPRHGSPMIKDELNPGDGLRTMFDWILSDLMQSHSPGQLATESKAPPESGK